MTKRNKELERAAVIELYQKGKSKAHIGRTVGVSQPTIRRWLDEEGLTGPKKLEDSDAKTQIQEKVVEMYQEGSSLKHIASTFEVSKTAVTKWLKKAGVYKSREDKQEQVLEQVKVALTDREGLARILESTDLNYEESQKITLACINKYRADLLRGKDTPGLNPFLKASEVINKMNNGGRAIESRGRLTLNLEVNKKKWKSQIIDAEVEEVDLEVEEPTTESE